MLAKKEFYFLCGKIKSYRKIKKIYTKETQNYTEIA